MKRSRPRREPEPAPPAPRPRRDLGRLATVALIALPIVAAALILRPRGNAPGRTGRVALADERVMLDSLKAADSRRDWVGTLLWAERLGVGRPRDHGVLLARGTAWSNYAIDQRPGRVRPRQALRNSLQRMQCLGHALGLMDSSSMATSDTTKWLDSGQHLAQLHETIGLNGDALIAYETIRQRLPMKVAPALRAYWLRALCYDPVDPDTSEWHRRRMQFSGRR